ncbi:hypothetical protein J2W55_000954 [Mucilaginibacter pocheonensis]|uniref:Uncharacterized protein n=1 Tax=Mucilaginibacter pocheonensis TaxID=398050 RepID=A0ABU1T7B5_9SPHI|nr:hypothetical protein [Mucilaginibacter pocheonensis]
MYEPEHGLIQINAKSERLTYNRLAIYSSILTFSIKPSDLI